MEWGAQEDLLEKNIWGVLAWGAVRETKTGRGGRQKSVFYSGKGRWGSQSIWGPTGHSDLWRYQGHEGQTLVGQDRWKREGQEVSQVKPTEECLRVEEFWRSGNCPLSVIPGPWGLPVREDNHNKQGWHLSTQEVPGYYKQGSLGRRRSKIEVDSVGSQFHGPTRTLSAQFTCLLTLKPSPPHRNVGCCSLGHFSPVCGPGISSVCSGPGVQIGLLTAPSGVHTWELRAAITGNWGQSWSTAAHRRDHTGSKTGEGGRWSPGASVRRWAGFYGPHLTGCRILLCMCSLRDSLTSWHNPCRFSSLSQC